MDEQTVKQMFGLGATKISDRLNAFKQFKEQTKQNAISNNIDKGFNNLEQIYTMAQTSTDDTIKKEANDSARKAELAMRVREQVAKQGKDWSSWTDP